MRSVYLDHAATTPLDPRAREAMLPWLGEEFANPSSLHAGGRRARMAVDEARESVADALGCLPGEILFTSSGTEAANLAILGTALSRRGIGRNRVLFGATEHHCVLHTRALLESFGYEVEIVPSGPDGAVAASSVAEALGDDALLVSVMHANNETGAINNAAAVGALCRSAGALYHCDAVQTFGLLPVRVDDLCADFVTISAHKMYGPKGVGALYVRAGVKPQPLSLGGGQEREMRAGTENVAAIVGFAEAVRIAMADVHRAEQIEEVRDVFIQESVRAFSDRRLPESHFTLPSFSAVAGRQSSVGACLPTHAHLRVPGADAATMLINLDRLGVAASSGAACSSGSIEPSHVLLAMGFNEREASEGLRFTFGKDSTVGDARDAASRLAEAATQVCEAARR